MGILWGYPQDFLWVWDGYGDRNSVPTAALAVPTKWRSYRDSDVTVTPLHPVYSVFFVIPIAILVFPITIFYYTPAAIDEAWVGLMLSVVGLSVCVCLPVLKKGKRLELSTPKSSKIVITDPRDAPS